LDSSEDNEQQIDENEKLFLFKIYPFLENLKMESILAFRELIREKDLTKGDLEKKREEWVKNETEEVQVLFKKIIILIVFFRKLMKNGNNI
jgi:hypothetical protein